MKKIKTVYGWIFINDDNPLINNDLPKIDTKDDDEIEVVDVEFENFRGKLILEKHKNKNIEEGKDKDVQLSKKKKGRPCKRAKKNNSN